MTHSLALWARQALLFRLTWMHVAAALFLLASGLANVRYGLSLAQSDLEKVIAVGASVGADIFNAVGFAAFALALTKRKYVEALAIGVVLVFTLSYAFIAGVGFASQTRSEVVGHRAVAERTDKLVAKDLASVEAQLVSLKPTRPAQQIQSEMDLVLSDKRADGCRAMDGPYTRQHCPRYFQLKGELAAAQERARLEAKKDDLSRNLRKADSVVEADPLASSLAAYVGKLGITVDKDNITPWLALMFVVVVVLGGPVAWWLAERDVRTSDAQPDVKPEQPAADVEEKRPVDTEPQIRPRKVAPLTPAAGATLKKLRQRGGSVKGKTQTEIATQLGVPRTSFRRVLDRLEEEKFVTTRHDAKGYQVQVVH
jgi:uncharacterized membrane protein